MDIFEELLDGVAATEFSGVDGGRLGSTVANWDGRFQLGLSLPSSTLEEQRGRLAHLNATYQDFVETSKRYTETLISELFLPPHLKTIRFKRIPDKGGEGEKYTYRGIVLKLATADDPFDGDYNAASKALGHELKGANHYSRCNISRLHIALHVLLDYRGYRVLAQSELPISSGDAKQPGTQRIGKARRTNVIYSVREAVSDKGTENDSGMSPNTEFSRRTSSGSLSANSNSSKKADMWTQQRLYDLMETASVELNLAPHEVYCETRRRAVKLPAAFDLEGHVGLDDPSRFYLLNFARTFPPESPKYAAHLFQQDAGDDVRASLGSAMRLTRSSMSSFRLSRGSSSLGLGSLTALLKEVSDAREFRYGDAVKVSYFVQGRSESKVGTFLRWVEDDEADKPKGRSPFDVEELFPFALRPREGKCLILYRSRDGTEDEFEEVDAELVDRCRASPILYRMLRPEFVRNRGQKLLEKEFDAIGSTNGAMSASRQLLVNAYLKAPPLSSDAFSPETKETLDGDLRNEEVHLASKLLFRMVIPRLAKSCVADLIDAAPAQTPSHARANTTLDGFRPVPVSKSQSMSSLRLRNSESKVRGMTRLPLDRSENASLLRTGQALQRAQAESPKRPRSRTMRSMTVLEEQPAEDSPDLAGALWSGERLCDTLHQNGVNHRHMGLLRAHCVLAGTVEARKGNEIVVRQAVVYIRRLILVEMVIRELKNMLKDLQRRAMETARGTTSYDIGSLVARFLNHITGAVPLSECTSFWEDLSDRILEHFGTCALAPKERGYRLFQLCIIPSIESQVEDPNAPSYTSFKDAGNTGIILANTSSDAALIITRLLQMSGVVLVPQVEKMLERARFGGAGFEFVPLDILRVRPVVKKMHKLTMIEGQLLHMEAMHREARQRAREIAREVGGEALKGLGFVVELNTGTRPGLENIYSPANSHLPRAAAMEIKERYSIVHGEVGDRVTQQRLDELASVAMERARRRVPDDVATRHLLADTYQSRASALRYVRTMEAEEERRLLQQGFMDLCTDDRNTRCALSKLSYTEDVLGIILAVKCLVSPRHIGKRIPRLQVFSQPVSLSAYLKGVRTGFEDMMNNLTWEEMEWFGPSAMDAMGPVSLPDENLADYIDRQREQQVRGRPPQYLTFQFMPMVVYEEHLRRSRGLLRYCIDSIVSMSVEPYIDIDQTPEIPDQCPIGEDALEVVNVHERYLPSDVDGKHDSVFANATEQDVEVHVLEVIGQVMNNIVVELAKMHMELGDSPSPTKQVQSTLEMYCRLHHLLLGHTKASEFMASRIERHVDLFREERSVRKNGRPPWMNKATARRPRKKATNAGGVGPSVNGSRQDPHCTPDLGVFLVNLFISESSWDRPKNKGLRDGFLRETITRRCYWHVSPKNKGTSSYASTLLYLEPSQTLEEEEMQPEDDIEGIEGLKMGMEDICETAVDRFEALHVATLALSDMAPEESNADAAVDNVIQRALQAVKAVQTCISTADISALELLRLMTTFSVSESMHKTLMYQVLFMRSVRAKDEANLLSFYNRSFGRPTPGMVEKLRRALPRAQNLAEYHEFFSFMNVWYSPKYYCAILRDCWRWAINENHAGMISEMKLDRVLRHMDCNLEKEAEGPEAFLRYRSKMAQEAFNQSLSDREGAKEAREVEVIEWKIVSVASRLVELLEQVKETVGKVAPKHPERANFERRLAEVSKKSEVAAFVNEAELKLQRESEEALAMVNDEEQMHKDSEPENQPPTPPGSPSVASTAERDAPASTPEVPLTQLKTSDDGALEGGVILNPMVAARSQNAKKPASKKASSKPPARPWYSAFTRDSKRLSGDDVKQATAEAKQEAMQTQGSTSDSFSFDHPGLHEKKGSKDASTAKTQWTNPAHFRSSAIVPTSTAPPKPSGDLQFAPWALRANHDYVLAAVAQNGLALRYATQEMRADRAVVLAALQHDWRALQYASDELKRDPQVALEAIQQNCKSILQPKPGNGEDESGGMVLTTAAHNHGTAFQYLPEDLRGSQEILLAAITQNAAAVTMAPFHLQHDRDFLLRAVRANVNASSFLDADIVSDPIFAIALYIHLREPERWNFEQVREVHGWIRIIATADDPPISLARSRIGQLDDCLRDWQELPTFVALQMLLLRVTLDAALMVEGDGTDPDEASKLAWTNTIVFTTGPAECWELLPALSENEDEDEQESTNRLFEHICDIYGRVAACKRKLAPAPEPAAESPKEASRTGMVQSFFGESFGRSSPLRRRSVAYSPETSESGNALDDPREKEALTSFLVLSGLELVGDDKKARDRFLIMLRQALASLKYQIRSEEERSSETKLECVEITGAVAAEAERFIKGELPDDFPTRQWLSTTEVATHTTYALRKDMRVAVGYNPPAWTAEAMEEAAKLLSLSMLRGVPDNSDSNASTGFEAIAQVFRHLNEAPQSESPVAKMFKPLRRASELMLMDGSDAGIGKAIVRKALERDNLGDLFSKAELDSIRKSVSSSVLTDSMIKAVAILAKTTIYVMICEVPSDWSGSLVARPTSIRELNETAWDELPRMRKFTRESRPNFTESSPSTLYEDLNFSDVEITEDDAVFIRTLTGDPDTPFILRPCVTSPLSDMVDNSFLLTGIDPRCTFDGEEYDGAAWRIGKGQGGAFSLKTVFSAIAEEMGPTAAFLGVTLLTRDRTRYIFDAAKSDDDQLQRHNSLERQLLRYKRKSSERLERALPDIHNGDTQLSARSYFERAVEAAYDEHAEGVEPEDYEAGVRRTAVSLMRCFGGVDAAEAFKESSKKALDEDDAFADIDAEEGKNEEEEILEQVETMENTEAALDSPAAKYDDPRYQQYKEQFIFDPDTFFMEDSDSDKDLEEWESTYVMSVVRDIKDLNL